MVLSVYLPPVEYLWSLAKFSIFVASYNFLNVLRFRVDVSVYVLNLVDRVSCSLFALVLDCDVFHLLGKEVGSPIFELDLDGGITHSKEDCNVGPYVLLEKY